MIVEVGRNSHLPGGGRPPLPSSRPSYRHRRFGLVASAMAALVVLLGLGGELAAQEGALWNGSESLPFGLYWRRPGPARPVGPGDFVVICTPAPYARLAIARGYLPRDTRGRGCSADGNPILKRIYAVAGDRYEVDAFGVSINGAVVRNSAPLRQDDRGRPLWDGRPHGATLGPHQVLALSAYNPASFDSRYFGPLDEREVLLRVRPVLTAPSDGSS